MQGWLDRNPFADDVTKQSKYDSIARATNLQDETGNYGTTRDDWTQMFAPNMIGANKRGRWTFAPYGE